MAEKAITLQVDLELQKAEQDLNNLEKNIKSLKNQLNVAMRNKDLHTTSVSLLKNDIALAKAELEGLTTELNSLAKGGDYKNGLIDSGDISKASELKTQIDSLTSELNALYQDGDSSKSLIKDSDNRKAEELKLRIDSLTKQLNSLYIDNDVSKGLINTGDLEKATQLEQEINSLNSTIAVYEQKLNSEIREAQRAQIDERNLRVELDNLQKKYKQAEQKAASLKQNVQELTQAEQEQIQVEKQSKLQTLQQGLYGVYQKSQQVVSAFSSMKGALTSSNAALGIAGAAFQAFKGIIKTVVNVFKSLANIVIQAGKTVVKWGSKIAKVLWTLPFTSAKSTDESTTSLKDLIKYFTKYVLGFRSFFYLYRRFRSEVVEGFENLAKYSETVNYAISDVISAFNQLKNAIATALAPIVTVGAPILSQFLQLCSKAANEIARITAMLTGQTSYVRANYVWEDYAESLEDASDASEKFLASFDTLEKLSSSSSSSGSDDTDVSDMFETVEIEPFDFDSWGEALDYFLDWLNDTAIPSLEVTFDKVADWINNLADNINEMFEYGDNLDEIKQTAANLAEQLNGLVADINWDSIGEALGNGINAALGWMNTFVRRFSWFDLGYSISQGINSAVETINWNEVGRWLWNKFLIAIEFLAGLITGGDTKSWAEAASDIIISFYNDMADTINDVDWETIGQKIRDFVDGIKWEEIGYAMQDGISAAFDAIQKADLAGTLGALLADIFNWAMSLLLGDDNGGLDGAVNDVLEGGLSNSSTGRGLFNTLTDYEEAQQGNGLIAQITSFVDRFIEVFKEEFDTDKWEEVSEQLEEAFDKVLDWAFDFIVPLVIDVAKKFADAFWEEINERTEEAAEEWRTSLFTKLFGEETASSMNDIINEFTEDVDYNPFRNSSEEAGELAGQGLLEGTETAVDDGASKTASGVASAMTSALKSALSIHSPSQVMYDEIGVPTAEGILTALQDTFADLTTWAKENISDPFIQDIQSSDMFSSDTWANFGKTAMTGLVDAFENGFNSIISGLNSLMSQVSSAVSQMSSAMSTITGSSGLVLSASTYSRLSSISLPALAEGAVIPPNREFMAVLGDQTSGTNIETPLNTMVEAFKQAMKDGDYTSSGNQTVVLEVDGTTLGSVVYNMNKKESRRIGTNLVTNR